MFDDNERGKVKVQSHQHFLKNDVKDFSVHHGATITEIVAAADVPARYGIPVVVLSKGRRSIVVPMDMWSKVRPKEDADVKVMVRQPEGGAIVAALGSAIIPQVAGAAAGALFAAGTLGYFLVYAAVTVVGALLIRALIAPGAQSNGNKTENFAITGVANAVNPNGVYPTVIGRHRMFPLKTATGYSETQGNVAFYYGRMTFGFGPVSIEDLRIGNTPIHQFEDIELEFLNVDKDLTLGHYPELADLVKPRTTLDATDRVKLYDIGDEYVFTPELESRYASITFRANTDGYREWRPVLSYTVEFSVSPVGANTWTVLDTSVYTSGDHTVTSPDYGLDGVNREYRLRVTDVLLGAEGDRNEGSLDFFGPLGDHDSGHVQVFEQHAKYQSTIKNWKYGTSLMRLYSDDVTEDTYNDLPDPDTPVIQYTRPDTVKAGIDISFSYGLYDGTDDGIEGKSVPFRFSYQSSQGGVNESDWVVALETTYEAKATSLLRFSEVLEFEEPDEYVIRVERLSGIDGSSRDEDRAYVTAIRSHGQRKLPSHDNVAEVAFRIRASDQLNSQIDSLSAVVNQLVPVWNGTSWSEPQENRHPAWAYAHALRGPSVARPVSDDRIDLSALLAWATEEPHWTCDYVVDSPTQVREVLQTICSSGRARFTLTDFLWSVIRDGAAGPVRQIFTPRNSWGFQSTLRFPKQIHGFRCMVRSERLGWEKDEVLVLKDGYTRETASKLETLELPGVVVTEEDEDEGNVYRLGRYHLAVALNRPETFELNVGWESLHVTRGDKVRIAHYVPLSAVGQGRVTSVVDDGTFVDTFVLDEFLDFASDVFRITVRTADGINSFEATSPTNPLTRTWTPNVNVPVEDIPAGALVVVEEVTQREADFVITNIVAGDRESARLSVVDARPEVLNVDTGGIPSYAPVVTNPRSSYTRAPEQPTVVACYSDARSQFVDAKNGVTPRIAVEIGAFENRTLLQGASLQLRWREADSAFSWQYGPNETVSEYVLFTDGLVEGLLYEVQVASRSQEGLTRGWVSAALSLQADSDRPDAPLIVPTFAPATVKDDANSDRRPAVSLSWVVPNNGAVAVAWRIRPTTDPTTVLQGQTSDFENPGVLISDGVLPNTTYQCAASFVTASGAYNWTDWENVTTPNVKLGVDDVSDDVLSGGFADPSIPTNVSISSSAGADGFSSVEINWDAVSPATGYDLEIAQDSGNPIVWRLAGNFFRADMLPGTDLSVRVRSVNGNKVSNYSGSVSHSVAVDNIPPAAPTNLQANAGFNAIWLTWDDNTENDLSFYEVVEQDNDTTPGASPTILTSTSSNTLARAGLDDNSTLYYWVRAVDTSGNRSPWSNMASDTTPVGEAVTTEALAGLVDATSFASSIQPVEVFTSALPTTDNYEGRRATLRSDNKLYVFKDGEWTAAVAAEDIVGTPTDELLAEMDLAKMSGLITNGQVDAGAIEAAQLAESLSGVEILDALPTENNFEPRVVYLTTDKALYRYDSVDGWDKMVKAGDLAANAVTAGTIEVGAVGADEIAADEILARHVAITDTNNILPDDRLRDVESWTLGPDFSLADATVNETTDRVILMSTPAQTGTAGATYQTALSDFMPMQPDTAYRVKGMLRAQAGPTGLAMLDIVFYDRALTEISTEQVGENFDLSGVVTQQTRQEIITSPAGAVYARLRCRRAYNGAGDVGGTVRFYNLAVHLAANGSLVVDGTLTSKHVAAHSLSASRMALFDMTNQVPNGNFFDDENPRNIWINANGLGDLDYSDTCETGQRSLRITKDAVQAFYWVILDEAFPVEPGTEVFWETAMQAETGDVSGVLLTLRWYDSTGAALTPTNVINGATINSGSWDKRTGKRVVPAGATQARVMIALNDLSDTDDLSLLVDRVIVRYANAAELVVEGSIVGNHMQAQTLTAREIAIGDFENFGGGQTFTGIYSWNSPHGNAPVADGGRENAFALRTGGGTVTYNGRINAAPTEQWLFRFDAYKLYGWDGGAGSRFALRDQSGNVVSEISLASADLTGAWATYEQLVTVPSGVTQLVPSMEIDSTVGEVYLSNVVIRRKFNGRLVVDGTLEADAIVSNSLTSAQVATGGLIADSIAAGAVIASKMGITDRENLFTDGAFSSGDPESLQYSGGAGSYAFNTTYVRNGEYSLALTKVNLTATYSVRCADHHLVPVEAGEEFWGEISARALSGSMAGGFYGRVVWYNATGATVGYTDIADNAALDDTGWSDFTRQLTAPANATQAGFTLFNHNNQTSVLTVLVDRIRLRRRNAGELIVDGSLGANKVDVDDLVVNGLATINTAYIKDANIDGQLNASKIEAGTALAGSITVDSTALSTVGSRAEDPASRINEKGTTQIAPGMVNISAGTSLADWRQDGDVTRIKGGAISANTVAANKLTIGSRGVNLQGIEFSCNSPVANSVSWASGNISYVGDDGTEAVVSVPAGNTALWTSGTIYIYWVKGESQLRYHSSLAVVMQDDRIVLASYSGGVRLNQNFGRTIIENGMIKTGTLTADRMDTASLSVAGLSVFGGSLESDDFVSGSAGWQIDSTGSAEFNDLIVRSSLQNNAVTDGIVMTDAGGNYENETVIMTYTLNRAVTMDDVWIIATTMDLKKRNSGTLGNYIDHKAQIQIDVMQNGSWIGWEHLYEIRRAEDDINQADPDFRAVSNSGIYAFEGENLRVRLRATDGDNDYQGFRNSSLFFKSIQR